MHLIVLIWLNIFNYTAYNCYSKLILTKRFVKEKIVTAQILHSFLTHINILILLNKQI